jgi:methanethiol S-methyltransferase
MNILIACEYWEYVCSNSISASGQMVDPAATRTPSMAIRAIAIAYGVVCHVSFVIGVGSMIAMMFFGMSRSFGRLEEPWSFAANLALLLQFPLTHSGLLSRIGGRALARLAPQAASQDLTTTIYASIASVQMAFLFLAWSPSCVIW